MASELRFRLNGGTPLRRSVLISRLWARMVKVPGRVRYRAGNQEYQDPATRRQAIGWVRSQLRSAGPNKRLHLRLGNDRRISIDAVEVGPVLGDPNFDYKAGDAAIEKIVRAAAGEFPKLLSLGGYVCKYIAKSAKTPSQHCMFGPRDPGCNAWDLALKRFGVYSVSLMWKLANWLVANADRLGIEVVIFRDKIWTRAAGWHPYGGVFHASHVHVNPPDRADLACSPS